MYCRPRHQCQSQLPGLTERRGEKEGSQTLRHVILHFPFVRLMPSTCSCRLWLVLSVNHLGCLSAPHSCALKSLMSPCFIISFSQFCFSQPFGTLERRREGRRRWDFGDRNRRPAGKGGAIQAYGTSNNKPKEPNELQRIVVTWEFRLWCSIILTVCVERSKFSVLDDAKYSWVNTILYNSMIHSFDKEIIFF